MLDVKFEYTSTSIKDDFKRSFIDAFSKINLEGQLLKMTVFSASGSMCNYFMNLNFIREVLKTKLHSKGVTISYISQKPLDSELAIEFVFAKKGATVLYTTYKYITYATLRNGNEKIILISGVHGSQNQSITQQSNAVFQVIGEILELENLPVSSIIRQWNYIPEITHFENYFQHYQQFNDARTLFYESEDWDRGFPAATGIGTFNAPLVVDVIAMQGQKKEIPLINLNQVNAHIYSDKVLFGAEDTVLKQRSTPKFERAKLIEGKQVVSVFISGTAAIIGEESFALNNASEQTSITIDNIKNLISNLNTCEPQLEFVRVYIKKRIDFEAIKNVCEKRLPNVKIIYVEADICREELLVEIEAFAKV